MLTTNESHIYDMRRIIYYTVSKVNRFAESFGSHLTTVRKTIPASSHVPAAPTSQVVALTHIPYVTQACCGGTTQKGAQLKPPRPQPGAALDAEMRETTLPTRPVKPSTSNRFRRKPLKCTSFPLRLAAPCSCGMVQTVRRCDYVTMRTPN